MTMNKTPNNNFCVILAGGKGRRLWPCSRESYPKQFIDFFGSGKTQLQQTYERFAKIIPQENIFINTISVFCINQKQPERIGFILISSIGLRK